MRITSGMIQNTSLNALYNNMGRLDNLYNQMNTFKKIQRPSDDPIVAGKSIKLKMSLLETEQYNKNVKEASSIMDTAETALSNMTEILKEIRTRCTQAANDTLEKEDREKILSDIQELYKQLQQEANTSYAGKYIFSGYKTDKALFVEDPANKGSMILNSDIIDTTTSTSHIEGQSISYEIGEGNRLVINTLGIDKVLNDIGSDIADIVDALADPDADLSKFFSDKLADFDKRIEDIGEKISEIGSKQKRLEYTEASLVGSKTNLTQILSDTEGVDIEKIYVEFNTQYMVYQSALQASSKMIQNTLADYLR